ncbi:MAG TPA: asparagine synthase (glutamine-hydrolyzing) [Anaerolineales bacterium]
MCGITGFLDTTHSLHPDTQSNLVKRMSDSIRHRGPDDSGEWCDQVSGMALGFRRLAILDLSPTGHQPMLSQDQRFVMVFNGEVYNFASLRDELLSLGHSFRGTSDTEIMLAAICQWGLHLAVQRFNGMFAFALWDRVERSLSLVRDRLGIKPLYYGWAGKTLLFGSELKALRSHPDFHPEIDRDALTLFMRHSYIPAPYTIYRGIKKLLPASILTVRANAGPGEETIQPYWSARETVLNGYTRPFTGDENEAIDALETQLTRSIGLRMIADVPLGAFLSGGIDSSTVVALMQKQSRLPVKTFTIGFDEDGFDEARHARAVAQHLGTHHTELYVTPETARGVIPRLPALFDEPFADVSQIPTFLVSQMAREHVTVSLSGDGGDELFGGYNRYFWIPKMWKTFGWLPLSVRKPVARGLGNIHPNTWDRLAGFTRLPNLGDKIHKLLEIMPAGSPEAIFLDLVSTWKHPSDLVIGSREPLTQLTDLSRWLPTPTLAERMMSLDLVTYLPDDILAKVDRASMGASLEARAPFLDDHETVEFAWKLPLNLKIRNDQGKWILRQILYRHVPRELVERPKMGFGVPIDSWLRGPLRGWTEALLNETRLRQEGYFNPELVRQKWQEHLAGGRNWQYYLWNVLMFQSWLEAN